LALKEINEDKIKANRRKEIPRPPSEIYHNIYLEMRSNSTLADLYIYIYI
jgi:hypothetical protein